MLKLHSRINGQKVLYEKTEENLKKSFYKFKKTLMVSIYQNIYLDICLNISRYNKLCEIY